MDKAKIAKLCNEIEDFACDISQQTMNDIVSAESRMIFDKAKEIAAEITAQPKTNADRIRQMTDEGLAESLSGSVACTHVTGCLDTSCYECTLIWLKQEVSEDADK